MIDSIVAQITLDVLDDVEIIISDNCSTDGTDIFIRKYIVNHHDIHIIYNKNASNLGADKNYIKSVELAKGEYAWIIGSDDKVCEGAIKRVLKEIEDHCSVYFSNRINYNNDFSICYGEEYFFNKYLPCSKTIQLKTDDDWNTYFNFCESIGGICSYLSSFFFDRNMFLSAEQYEEYIGTAYVHVFMLFRGLQMKNEPFVRIIKEPYVMCRMGDDSFYVNDFQRRMLDFDGYIKISDIFSNPVVKYNFLSIVRKSNDSFPVKMLLKMSKKERIDFINVLKKTGYPVGYIDVLYKISKHKLISIFLFSDRIIPTLMANKIWKK